MPKPVIEENLPVSQTPAVFTPAINNKLSASDLYFLT